MRRTLLAAPVLAIALLAGTAGTATASVPSIGTPPPSDERCKVPPLLYQAAAIVDPDSLEGCNFFEDPNYHENRKEAGLYTDKGAFSLIFG